MSNEEILAGIQAYADSVINLIKPCLEADETLDQADSFHLKEIERELMRMDTMASGIDALLDIIKGERVE